MPNYDYKCKDCSHSFEVFQSMKDLPLKKCPKCGGEVERLIGKGAGIIFKGSGFYATDYKKSGKKDKKNQPDPKVPDQCKSCDQNACRNKP